MYRISIKSSRRRSRLLRQAVEMCAKEGWQVSRISDSQSHYMTHAEMFGEIRVSDHPTPAPKSDLIDVNIFHPAFPFNLTQAFEFKRANCVILDPVKSEIVEVEQLEETYKPKNSRQYVIIFLDIVEAGGIEFVKRGLEEICEDLLREADRLIKGSKNRGMIVDIIKTTEDRYQAFVKKLIKKDWIVSEGFHREYLKEHRPEYFIWRDSLVVH